MLFSGSRQLRLAGILSALALVGCGGGPKHNPPGGTGGTGGTNGYASFSWDIYDATATTILPCAQVGAAKVVVTLFPEPSGTPAYKQDAVSCAAGEISTSYVPAGSYWVQLDLYGDPAIYGNADTPLDSFSLADSSGTPLVFPLGPGFNDYRGSTGAFVVRSFLVGWSVYVSSVLSSCAAVGATYVDLDFAVGSSSAWVTSRFACATGEGASYAIPYGETTAQWRLYLVDAAGNDIPPAAALGGTVGVSATADVGLGTQIFSF